MKSCTHMHAMFSGLFRACYFFFASVDLWLSFPLLNQHLSACQLIYHLTSFYFLVNYCLPQFIASYPVYNVRSFFFLLFSLTHLGHCPIFVSFGWTETSSPHYLLWVQTASDWLIIILVICPDGLKYLVQIKVQILADVVLFRCCLPLAQLNECMCHVLVLVITGVETRVP